MPSSVARLRRVFVVVVGCLLVTGCIAHKPSGGGFAFAIGKSYHATTHYAEDGETVVSEEVIEACGFSNALGGTFRNLGLIAGQMPLIGASAESGEEIIAHRCGWFDPTQWNSSDNKDNDSAILPSGTVLEVQ